MPSRSVCVASSCIVSSIIYSNYWDLTLVDPAKLNVKLNELAKQILMLLPVLLLLLLLLYVLYHALIRGRFAAPYNYVVSTYGRSSSRSNRGSSIEICFANSFS